MRAEDGAWLHAERGEPGRHRIIARRGSYHGNTLGALSAGGNATRRAPYADILLPACSHIDPCYPYRFAEPGESPEAYGLRAADLLEAEILRLGPETVSCFVAETVVGATLGCVPPAPGYLARIREICDRYGVLLILDEVMCGIGRTGWLHACEAEAVVPDILCMAKGLGGGYLPLGAVLCQGEIFDAFAAGTRGFVHGHTFSGHAVLCAAALAVQRAIRGRDLLPNVRARGAQLRAGLDAALGEHPNVGEISGPRAVPRRRIRRRPRRPRRRSSRGGRCIWRWRRRGWRAG